VFAARGELQRRSAEGEHTAFRAFPPVPLRLHPQITRAQFSSRAAELITNMQPGWRFNEH